jgi:hypothetical protein
MARNQKNNGREHVEFSDRAMVLFYERALSQQWHVDQDVDWNALSFEWLPPQVRSAMGVLYSFTTAAERHGFVIGKHLLEVVPEGLLRQFLTTQVVDEARHVEFFGRVARRLSSGANDAPEWVAALDQELLATRDELTLVLHCFVIENLAQALFIDTARRSRQIMSRGIMLPGSRSVHRLLGYLIGLVGRDEARHVGFEMRYLRSRLLDISRLERARLERQAATWGRLMSTPFEALGGDIARLGMNVEELLARAWGAQRAQFRRVNLELPDLGDAATA